MEFSTRPEITGTFGAVASTHYLASASGMAVLEAGGNAFDAAVAAGFVLQVVEPHLNGPGGDLPLIFTTPGAEPVVLCGQGPAPAAATIAHLTDLGLHVVPGTGLLAAAIPGATLTWLRLLRDHGTMRPREVVRYAIEYAEHGHPILATASAAIVRMADYFTEHWPTSARQWLRADGAAPSANEIVRNRTWAQTLTRLCDEAESRGADRVAQCDGFMDAWRSGFVADAIDRFVQDPVRDSSGRRHGGVLTGADLAQWEPSYESPVSLDFRGHRIYKCDVWTQGPALLQQLALLDPILPDRLPGWDLATVHAATEVAKLSFADRDAHFGDSSDRVVTTADLLDEGYLGVRRNLIGDTASRELRPGTVAGHEGRLPAQGRVAGGEPVLDGLGEPTVARDGQTRGDTCHVDVADRWGNVVSATPSGGWLHSSPYLPELGFCLGTRLQMAWLQDGLPASLQPGRRPRTTLSPSLMIDGNDGRTTAFGTPGGDQQDQWQLVFVLAHLLRGLDLQQAIDAPAWHSEAVLSSFEPRVWSPARMRVESRIGQQVIDGLRRLGHDVEVADPWSLGRLSAVSFDPESSLIRAAANPRGMQGYAIGR